MMRNTDYYDYDSYKKYSISGYGTDINSIVQLIESNRFTLDHVKIAIESVYCNELCPLRIDAKTCEESGELCVKKFIINELNKY